MSRIAAIEALVWLALVTSVATFESHLSQQHQLYDCLLRSNHDQPSIGPNCTYCYTMWEESEGDVVKASLQQGCFNYDGSRDDAEECHLKHCHHVFESNAEEEDDDRHRFCCCSANLCNSDYSSVSHGQLERLSLVGESSVTMEALNGADALMYVAAALFVLVLVSCVFLCRGRRKLATGSIAKPRPRSRAFDPFDVPTPDCFASLKAEETSDFSKVSIDPSSVGTVLGSATFGSTLHKAVMHPGSKPVLVKLFKPSQKQSYFNERDVYEAIKMAGESSKGDFLKCFSTSVDSVHLPSPSDYDNAVILEWSGVGFLDEYLQRNTLPWTGLCKMLRSISSGLSFLHSGSRNIGFNLPGFAHRSISSGNLLVKPDLTCCICNFEQAVAVDGPQKPDPGIAGTWSPRYLAPEVLDGNRYADVASAEKHSDVYALGLVFWEVARRCHDLYQGVPVPPFQLAFQQELGHGGRDATLERMRILVSDRKARPLFPEVWKNSNPAIRLLRETIEDSWDADGEARLTAFCILERVGDLPLLWDRYHRSHFKIEETSCNNIINTTEALRRSNISYKSNHLQPVDDGAPCAKNNNVTSCQQPLVQIQPHQGRNPCTERNNLNAEPPQTAGSSSLVYGSVKDRLTLQTDSATRVPETERRLPRPRNPTAAQPIYYPRNDFNSEGIPEPEGLGRFWFLKSRGGQNSQQEAKTSNLDVAEQSRLLGSGSDGGSRLQASSNSSP